MDNCGPHGSNVLDIRGQVRVFPLRPNCTALHQPMDLGVIAAWKVRYRTRMLTEIMGDIENQSSKRDASKNRTSGMKGIQKGYEAHMLVVSRISKLSWDDILAESIARCWVKSRILPISVGMGLAEDFEKRKVSLGNDAEDIVEMMGTLSIRGRAELFRNSDVLVTPSKGDIESWFGIECDEEVQDGMIEDAMDEVEDGMGVEGIGQIGDISDNGDGGETVVCAPIPRAMELTPLSKLWRRFVLIATYRRPVFF